MGYKEYLPGAELKDYVDCFWTQEPDSRHLVLQNPIDKILPDGCIDILFRTPKMGHGPNSADSYIVGTMTTAIDVPRGPSEIVAVRFRPGGALPFLKISANCLTDNSVNLTDLYGDRTNSLTDRIFNEPAMHRRIKVLELFLLKLKSSNSFLESSFSRTLFSIESTKEFSRIEQLCEYWGKSVRQIERSFLNQIGITPKMYLKVKRFQSLALNLKKCKGNLEWANLAANYGYYDQSHLIRDCKALTGLTPEKYKLFLKMSHLSNTVSPAADIVHQKGERYEF